MVEQLAEGPNSLVFLGSRNLDAGRVAASKITPHETSRVVAVQLDITDDNSIKAASASVQDRYVSPFTNDCRRGDGRI